MRVPVKDFIDTLEEILSLSVYNFSYKDTPIDTNALTARKEGKKQIKKRILTKKKKKKEPNSE